MGSSETASVTLTRMEWDQIISDMWYASATGDCSAKDEEKSAARIKRVTDQLGME